MSRPDTGGANELFLTGLDLDVVPIRTKQKDERLNQVRKDHKKLMDIVGQFGNKVGGMIDKQRYEFMNAYEQHIQDVQNELQSLREKVAEISGEETRKAKLKSLDIDQTRLKAEALRLDQEAVSLRKQMRKLVNHLHSVENDRNWTYKRLETAKVAYLATAQESNKLAESLSKAFEKVNSTSDHDGQHRGDDNMSLGSGMESNTSSQMTLQVAADRARNEIDAQKRVDETYKVSRDQALLVALPRIIGSGNAGESQVTANEQSFKRGGKNSMYQASKGSTNRDGRSSAEKQALADLVALRAKQESMRDFIAQCASNCDKGPWARIQRDPIEELMKNCRSVASDPDPTLREEERFDLAMQLVTVPELYYVISDMMIGKERQVESSLNEYFGFGSEAPLGTQDGMQMSAPQGQSHLVDGTMNGGMEEEKAGSSGNEELLGGSDIMAYFRQSQEAKAQRVASMEEDHADGEDYLLSE
jgi:hypothetical protein